MEPVRPRVCAFLACARINLPRIKTARDARCSNGVIACCCPVTKENIVVDDGAVGRQER